MTGYASIDKPWLKYYPQYLIEKELPKATMYDYILKGNNFYPNRVALNYFNNKITYYELIQRIDTTARAFLEMGVKKGDTISISTPTLPEFVYMFYAISKIGAVANMIDPRKSGEEIEEYLDNMFAKVKDLGVRTIGFGSGKSRFGKTVGECRLDVRDPFGARAVDRRHLRDRFL